MTRATHSGVPAINATPGDIAKMYNLMELHLRKIEGTDLCVYEEGWNDTRIAKEIGPDRLNPSHARNIRMKEFGRVMNTPSSKPSPELEHKIDELTDRFNRLCDVLSVNKIFDVRYLKTGVPHAKG